MSYRRKRLCILIGVITLSFGMVTGCAGTINNIKNVSSAEAGDTDNENETDSGKNAEKQLSYEDMFTERDLTGEYDDKEAVHITLSDEKISTDAEGVTVEEHTVTITEAGTYVFSGTLSEGQIVVDAKDAKVQIVLEGVDITCATSAAIYVKNADKVFVTLADGSENVLRNTGEYVAVDDNNIDAVIFSKANLTLNGNGSLMIEAENGHGIVSKGNLKITGGTYNITAEKHALSGKDSVRIAGGTFNLASGKDGIHAENEKDEEKGYIYIADGSFTIVSDGDGMDASGIVQIEDGTFDITAGGGAANSTKTHESDMPGGYPGGGKMPEIGEKPDGDMPQMGEKPDGDMPQMGERPDGDMPPEKPSGDNFNPNGTMPQQDTGNEDTSNEENSTSADVTAAGTENVTNEAENTAAGAESEEAETETNEIDETDSSTSVKGIKSDSNIYLNGGIYTIDSADDSIHSNASITISDGSYTLATGDDGVHADNALVVDGGTITITESYEGLEGLTVTINDGTIDITSSDDGINAAGGTETDGFEMWMEINGGYIHMLAGGDGLDSNGDLTINSGEIYIDGPSDNGNSAIDYGDRSSAYVNGGTLVAIGSSGMAEEMSDASKQEVIMVKLGEQKQAGEVTLTDSDGTVLVSYTAMKAYDCVIISTADIKSGVIYTLEASGTTTEVTVDEE